MNKAIALALVSLLAVSSHASTEISGNLRDVRNSLYCLTRGPFLHLANVDTSAIQIRFSRDDHSYADERHLFIFVPRKGSAWEMFDLVVNGRNYEIANNATLKARGRDKEYGGVDFVKESLGGEWTHKFIAKNFLAGT